MPTITFRVNLETVNRISSNLPNAPSDAIDNFRSTRSTWFPDAMLDNRALKHGDEFTVSGMSAIYLKNNYTTGDEALLTIVSEA